MYLHHVRKGAAGLLLVLGLAHIAATPTMAWESARAALDFAGTGVAVILVGIVNLLAEPNGRERPRSRSVVHAVNAVYLAFAAVLAVLAPSGPVVASLVLVLVIGAANVWLGLARRWMWAF